jgi:hypothetical protein
MTRFRTFVMAAGLAPFMGIAAAQAGSITETGTVATQTTDFNNVVFGNVTNGANSTTFAGFNSALGTLTEVDVTLTLNGTETGTLTNTAAGSETFQFSSFSGGALSTSAGGPAAISNFFNNAGTASGDAVQLNEARTSYTLGAVGSGTNSTSILPTPNAFGTGTASATGVFTGADANEFIGNNFKVDLSTLSGSNFIGGGGNIMTTLITQDGATLSITFDYTPFPVPEPGTVATLAAGLLGLTALRFRKRA